MSVSGPPSFHREPLLESPHGLSSWQTYEPVVPASRSCTVLLCRHLLVLPMTAGLLPVPAEPDACDQCCHAAMADWQAISKCMLLVGMFATCVSEDISANVRQRAKTHTPNRHTQTICHTSLQCYSTIRAVCQCQAIRVHGQVCFCMLRLTHTTQHKEITTHKGCNVLPRCRPLAKSDAIPAPANVHS